MKISRKLCRKCRKRKRIDKFTNPSDLYCANCKKTKKIYKPTEKEKRLKLQEKRIREKNLLIISIPTHYFSDTARKRFLRLFCTGEDCKIEFHRRKFCRCPICCEMGNVVKMI